jgi:hypothetical protein
MMMKKVLLLVGFLSMGGCTTTGAIDVTTIQQDAVLACGFLPTVGTVANIIAVGNPLLATAEAVAAAICAAVAPAKASGRLGAVAPQVNGVTIHGRFVQ